MCTHYPHIASYSPGWANRRRAKLLNMSIVLLIIIGVLISPALTNAAYADGSQDTTQNAVTMAGCYGVYHIVRPGQTLYSIAAAYRTTAYRIAVCNGLSSYTVYVGQALLVPSRTR
jgi:hypothetical protein